ncbi:MAG: metallophosphoesterase [Moraxella sp.]|nr:metallophosphoesterase [Moraxella sp.]
MRSLMIVVNIVLLQLLTFGLLVSLRWLVSPVVSLRLLPVGVGIFILSNALLIGGLYLGMFRIAIGWLAVLWLGFLSAMIAVVLILIAKKLGLGTEFGYRLTAVASLVGVLALSVYNAYTPVVRHLSLTLDKPMPAPVRLAVASDTHLGHLIGNRQLSKLADILEREQVDVLLMPGDVMDDDTIAFERKAMADNFAKVMQAPAVAAVASLGNHDLYRTPAYGAITAAITDSKAILLNDDVAVLDVAKDGASTRLNVIGRFDDHYQERASTASLVSRVDTAYPTIVLDHRPSEIESNVQLPIDLQVSGHTHNGQIFPANFIVARMNRVGYGYEQINGTHVVVSSGFGFWGIPFRLGSQAEVWVIELTGRE